MLTISWSNVVIYLRSSSQQIIFNVHVTPSSHREVGRHTVAVVRDVLGEIEGGGAGGGAVLEGRVRSLRVRSGEEVRVGRGEPLARLEVRLGHRLPGGVQVGGRGAAAHHYGHHRGVQVHERFRCEESAARLPDGGDR